MGADFVFQALPVAKLNKRRLSRLNKLVSQTGLVEGMWDDLAAQHADLREAVSEYAGFDDNEKEVGTLTLSDLPYSLYISGGVSWGDDPTEAFRYMTYLELFDPLFDQLREWAIEDAKKGR